ncbi:hypothetical protein [Comamonas sp.]|uniref:hypothetical protein n=1 Tax=Comamonas sp. TaxID=34028 RepID=UPI0028B01FC4|nr:hypothetical protein [Comamonas sp.]
MTEKQTISQERTTGQIIFDTLQDLHQQGQVATRELLCDLTGFKMTIVDDHISRMIENGRVHRLRAGVFTLVAAMPEPRAISMTRMGDGTTILEIGECVVHIYPRERRELATMLVGDAVQYSNIQAGVEAGVLATELSADLLATKREMGNRIVDLEKQLAATRAQQRQGDNQLNLIGG